MPEQPTGTMTVWGRFDFPAFHKWSGAPQGHYLGSLHRHRFHVVWHKKVTHDDRDIEFIELNYNIENKTKELTAEPHTQEWSCEHWARWMGWQFGLDRVRVSEDNEHGAEWTREG